MERAAGQRRIEGRGPAVLRVERLEPAPVGLVVQAIEVAREHQGLGVTIQIVELPHQPARLNTSLVLRWSRCVQQTRNEPTSTRSAPRWTWWPRITDPPPRNISWTKVDVDFVRIALP